MQIKEIAKKYDLSQEPIAPSSRIAAIDLIRGAVMILMAIDHVRVYSGLPAGGPTPGIFLTRWVTHFCAPAFLFLAGTSAFFYGRKHGNLARNLLIRGAWLIFLELTFLRVAWTFNLDFAHYEMAGVIWAIGWCMILLAGLVKLPPAVVGAIGLVIIAGHNLIDPYLDELIPALGNGSLGGFWKILYLGFFAGPIRFGADGPNLIVLYSIVPWIGVMAAGYAFGKILTFEPAQRNRICLRIGLGTIGLFLVLRGFNLYGDPRSWVDTTPMPALFAFLNTTKYPASLAFLLMTLAPCMALIPLLERARGTLARWITIFGRVPFFYYILHIPLIHVLALVVSKIRLGEVSPWLFANHPMGNPPAPDGYTWSLALLYVVFAVAIAMLYFPCRWFADLKAKRNDWWLRYL
ncbi:heparan-alpha-glucosaminide N-acetyltransferase domain-containing protein [candidate division KSB1 bacterium]|nr:heparan-alpha-glucosaminide N-acetyltransferase domain-containing protein [candidate division KSB1 bacterium]